MNPEDKKSKLLYSIRYTMKREDIMTFVNGLHEIQTDMIEQAVERSGYRDAKELIDYIKSL